MRITLAGLAILIAVTVQAQNTGIAAANGTCNLANSGSNNTNTVVNCGVGIEQGKKIITLLNAVLANRDLAAVNAKLDELLKIASTPVQTQNCSGSNCVQGTNYGPMTLNQYGAPKLLMADDQQKIITDAMKPYAGLKVVIGCQTAEDVSPYATQLYLAFHNAGMTTEAPQCAINLGDNYPIPSGVSFKVSTDLLPQAKALAGSMVSAGLLTAPVKVHWVDGANEFVVYITPNR